MRLNPEDRSTECSEFVFQFSRGRISYLQVGDEWIYTVGCMQNHKAVNVSIYSIIIFPECCKKYKATIDKCSG